jgi:hypothetical protein
MPIPPRFFNERDGILLLDEQGPPPQEIRDAVYGYVEERAE